MGEAAIFNEGGFTYPLDCKGDKPECTATAKYTNNTGWVDFIITPTVGTLWMIGEDTDRPVRLGSAGSASSRMLSGTSCFVQG